MGEGLLASFTSSGKDTSNTEVLAGGGPDRPLGRVCELLQPEPVNWGGLRGDQWFVLRVLQFCLPEGWAGGKRS